MKKTGWAIALLLVSAAPTWAQGNAVKHDDRPIVGQHEEMLWRECQKEPMRQQPTATAPKGGACEQLAESQKRRGYVEPEFDSKNKRWKY